MATNRSHFLPYLGFGNMLRLDFDGFTHTFRVKECDKNNYSNINSNLVFKMAATMGANYNLIFNQWMLIDAIFAISWVWRHKELVFNGIFSI